MSLLSTKPFGSEKDETGRESKLVIDSVFRTALPSRYKRDAPCVNIVSPPAPGTVLRLLNVHLASLDSSFRRVLRMEVLASLLREPGCSGGVIAGDFNAFLAADYDLVDKHGPVDAWVALHGKTVGSGGGVTWGVDVELEEGLKPSRLDKIVMLGMQPDQVDVLRPGLVDGYTPWSDHCDLRCKFTI